MSDDKIQRQIEKAQEIAKKSFSKNAELVEQLILDNRIKSINVVYSPIGE